MDKENFFPPREEIEAGFKAIEKILGDRPVFRLCTTCLVKWKREEHGADCPKCGINGFFTINSIGIGAALYMEEEGRKLSDFQDITKKD